MEENPVENGGGGYPICDMQRLKRFIVLGSESNTYNTTAKNITILGQNVQCVRKLLENNHIKEVLDLIEDYSKEGRVPKEDPILVVLGICADYGNDNDNDIAVRKAAYERVNSICNIPTKLFRFIELTHKEIVHKRIENPPKSQPSKKRKHISEKCVVSSDDPKPPNKKEKENLPELKKVNTGSRKSSGWGRMRRKGIAKFYIDEKKDPCHLLYLLTKYKRRNNWSHKQVLGYAHPKMKGEQRDAKNLVLKYCMRGYNKVVEKMTEMEAGSFITQDIAQAIDYIKVINEVSNLSPNVDGDEEILIKHLKKYGVRSPAFCVEYTFGSSKRTGNKEGKKSPIQLVREHIPTAFLNSQKVWEELLVDMPMTAMIRNLGKMSSLNMFEGNSTNTDIVVRALNNAKRLQSARVHPMKILIALEVYRKGHGDQGNLKWKVNENIREALNAAFHHSFRSPETFKTSKKYMLALDISSSMTGSGCSGCPTLTPAMASIAMAMVTWNIEDDVDIMAFGTEFQDMKPILNKDMTIDAAMKAVQQSIRMGGKTDCSLPMNYAREMKKEVDVFIVYTVFASETNYSTIQPMTALRLYNEDMNKEAKLIVCGMQSNEFTIADPKNDITLDIVGFDENVPEIIKTFVNGDISMKCDVCEGCRTRMQEE